MAKDWLTYQDPMSVSVPSNKSVEQIVFSMYESTFMLFIKNFKIIIYLSNIDCFKVDGTEKNVVIFYRILICI